MRKHLPRLVAAVTLTGLVGAACSNGGGDSASDRPRAESTTTTLRAPKTVAGPDSPAATLRADLTAALQEHVYLAGAATGAATGGRVTEFEAASDALDANSVELSQAMGSIYGTDAEKAFLDLWRRHIGFFVDYTQGRAAGDLAKVEAARADLDQYRSDFGAFLASANPHLTKEAVAADLKVHIDTLFAAIDAQAAQDPKAFDRLKEAADHMPMTAATLAGAIARQKPDRVAGQADAPAATLRAGLTAALQGHVYLAGAATGAATGGRAPEFQAAAATLDDNSVELSRAVGSVYGPDAEKTFLDLWRRHIGFFVDYTQGWAAGDLAKVDGARANLDQYRSDFGAFLASANPHLTKQAVAADLKIHIDTLIAAIDAQANEDPSAFDKLKEAAGHMPMTAATLAGAIATHKDLT